MRAILRVSGVVQGVGFRPFVYRLATELGLKGFVQNLADAGVLITVQGSEERIQQFTTLLRTRKPPLAVIQDLQAKVMEEDPQLTSFVIIPSAETRELTGSVIPADIAICNGCAKELADPANRRHRYFFITCTDCGPRFTTITTLPYDRPNTTLAEFRLCPACQGEFEQPTDRRFHAQTIACQVCGPDVRLLDAQGRLLDADDPLRETARLLDMGALVAIKGYGGYHLAAAVLNDAPLQRLRAVKHRGQKPFAIMACDLATVRGFAEVTEEEAAFLTSPAHPIVLLRKRASFPLSAFIAPALHTVGVMLPYSGLHLLLFEHANEPAYVLTSANHPGEPLVVDDGEAVRELGKVADYVLVNTRRIAQRCDDSVVRVNNGSAAFIRRSRGYAPLPLVLQKASRRCVLAVGAELNVTASVLHENRIFMTQHIGDVERIETYRYLQTAISHLLDLTNARPEALACDLHPSMNTTRMAERWSRERHLPLFRIQHHHAHLAALMAEHGLDGLVGLVCDGVGYGRDGDIWGGEVLYCDTQGYRRLGHLAEQPMIGGDLATNFPLRMLAGILRHRSDIEDCLVEHAEHFPGGRREVEAILRILRNNRHPRTSSTGRILDAVAALLGVCHERTYEGEPAMKLEAVAAGGRNVLSMEPVGRSSVLETTPLLEAIWEERKHYRVADLAYSAEEYLARGLAQMAVEQAVQLGLDIVGFSGGVAYNAHMVSAVREVVEGQGLRVLLHSQIPPGDGGISVGQTFTVALREGEAHSATL